LSGLFAGIGCYFQPTILFLPLIFGAGLFIHSLRKAEVRACIINGLKATVVMITVLVLVISPWVVRNYRVTGAVIGMRPGLWSGLWEGFGEFGDNPVGAQLSDEATYELAKEELGYDAEYLSPAYQAFFKPKVIEAIKEHPVWYMGLVAKRIPRAIFNFSELGIQHLPMIKADYNTWMQYLYGANAAGYVTAIKKMIQGMSDGTFWKMIGQYSSGASYLILVWAFAIIPPLLSVLALWIVRNKWRVVALVMTVPIYFIVIHMFMFVASYKSIVPACLGFIILSAVIIDYLYIKIKGGKEIVYVIE